MSKRPRFIIGHIEAECFVSLYDKDNILIISEIMEDQDPYVFISRLRESVDEAEISEHPKLSILPTMPQDSTVKSTNPYIAMMQEKLDDCKKAMKVMQDYIDEHVPKEHSFTENLS